MVWLIVILGFVGALAIAVAVSLSAHADALQAQAAIEAARAAQIAAGGQAVNATLLTALVVAFGFALLLALLLLGYLVWQNRKGRGKWLPGPNARWGRVGEAPRPASLPQGEMLQQLIQLEMLRLLRQLNQRQAPQLPGAGYDQLSPRAEDDDELW